MKSLVYSCLSLALLSMALVFQGCQKKGDPGPAGPDGVQGAGFDNVTKNGNILLFLDGVLPSGTPYHDTLNYRFSPGDLGSSSANGLTESPDFFVRRYVSFDNYDESESDDDYFQFYLGTGESSYFDGNFVATITTANHHYQRIHQNFYNDDGTNVNNMLIEEYSYDVPTGHLKFKFSFNYDSGNETEHEIDVTGIVDVTVYK